DHTPTPLAISRPGLWEAIPDRNLRMVSEGRNCTPISLVHMMLLATAIPSKQQLELSGRNEQRYSLSRLPEHSRWCVSYVFHPARFYWLRGSPGGFRPRANRHSAPFFKSVSGDRMSRGGYP